MARKSLPPVEERRMSAVLRSWILALKDKHRQPRTIHLYQSEVEKQIAYVGDLPIDKVSTDDMRRYRQHLVEKGLADTSQNLVHRALNVFFNFAIEEGDLETSPMARLKAPKIDSEKSRRFHVPTDAELDRVFAEIAKDEHLRSRTRDTAILRLLMDTGMRLGELAALQVDDVDLDQRMAHIKGKTGYRSVRFSPKAARALDRYFTQRARHYARDSKALWLARAGNMTDSGIGQMVRDRARVSLGLAEGGNEIDLQWLAGGVPGRWCVGTATTPGMTARFRYDRVPR